MTLRILVQLALLIGLLSAPQPSTAQHHRHWYDSTCKHRITASLYDLQGSTVRLRKPDGSLLTVQETDLCRANQEYLDAYQLTIQAAQELGASPYIARNQELRALRTNLLQKQIPARQIGQLTAPQSPTADRLLQQLEGRTVEIRGAVYRVKRVRVSPRVTGIEELVVKVHRSPPTDAIVLPQDVEEVIILPDSFRRLTPHSAQRIDASPFRQRAPPTKSRVLTRHLEKYTLVYDPVFGVWTDPKAAAAHQLLATARGHWDQSAQLDKIAQARWHVHRGITRARRKLHDHAIQEFSAAIQLAPKDAQAYLLRGVVFRRLNSNPSALTDLDQAIALATKQQSDDRVRHKTLRRAFETRALVRSAERMHDAAIEDARQAVALNSEHTSRTSEPVLFKVRSTEANDTIRYTHRVLREYEQGRDPGESRFEDAVAEAAQAERYNPDKSDATFRQLSDSVNKAFAQYLASYAQRHFDAGDVETAIGYAERAVAANPDVTNHRFTELLLQYRNHARDLFSRQAESAIQRRSFAEAVAHAESAHRLGPQDSNDESQHLLAQCYFLRGARQHFPLRNFDESIGDLTKSLKIIPGNLAAYRYRGRAHLNLNRLSQALADFDQAIQLGEESDEIFFLRGTIHAAQDRPEFAIRDVTEAMRRNPQESRYPFVRSHIHYALGNSQQAIDDVTTAINGNSANPDFYHFRAKLSLAQNDLKRAEIDSERFLQLAPTSPASKQLSRQIQRRLEAQRKNNPNYVDEEALPLVAAKLVGAVILHGAAKDGAKTFAEAEEFMPSLGAFAQLAGATLFKDKMIESAVNDVFPNLPPLEKSIVKNMVSELIGALYEDDATAQDVILGTGQGVGVDTFVASVKEKHPRLAIASQVGAFLYEINSQIEQQRQRRN